MRMDIGYRYKDLLGVATTLIGLYYTSNTPSRVLLTCLLVYCTSSLLSNKLTTGQYLPRPALTSLEWSTRTVIITGGNGGVGTHLCRQFIEKGCRRVISLDISPPPPQLARVVWIRCDLSSVSDTLQTISQITTSLIHNGITSRN